VTGLASVAEPQQPELVPEPIEEIEFPDTDETGSGDEPEVESEVVDPDLPVTLDHLMIAHIIAIHSPAQFLALFADFERQIEAKLVPLKSYLRKVIMTTEVTQLELHAAHVERWRSDCTRFLSLASAFVEHGKSSHFMDLKIRQDGGRKMTDGARDAYKRSMTAGYAALVMRLDGLIDDIDSRVNLCKKFTDDERAGYKNFGRTISEGRSSYNQ
jgi:hypothetical protein